jgi:hypothetical protein
MPSMHSNLPQREHLDRSRLFRYRAALVRPPESNREAKWATLDYSGFGFFSPGHLPVVR